jgi:tetratricopeptide (TPR) repeat protein
VLLLPLFALLLAQPHPLMREYNRAWQLVGQRRAGEAIPLLKAIIAKDKTFYRAYECLATAHSQEKQPEAAETYFRSLLAADPGNGLAHYGLGSLYHAPVLRGVPEARREHLAPLVRGLCASHDRSRLRRPG